MWVQRFNVGTYLLSPGRLHTHILCSILYSSATPWEMALYAYCNNIIFSLNFGGQIQFKVNHSVCKKISKTTFSYGISSVGLLR